MNKTDVEGSVRGHALVMADRARHGLSARAAREVMDRAERIVELVRPLLPEGSNDRFVFLWEPMSWRVQWWLLDSELPKPSRELADSPPTWRSQVCASGRAMTLATARRRAYKAMQAEIAWDHELPNREDGSALALVVEGEMHANRVP